MTQQQFYKNIELAANKTGMNPITFFNDLLNYIIAGHSHSIKIDTSKYSSKKLEYFKSLYRNLIMLQYTEIVKNENKWFDPLGEFFEIHSSRSSRNAKGQFFSPEPLCNLMTMINPPEFEGARIVDPASGSGRFSIASHAHYPNNFHYAIDLDRTCCLMTAVNMMLHGCRGEVVWKNALDFLDYKEGWSINPRIILLKGVPHIESLEKEHSLIYQNGLADYEKRKNEIKQEHTIISNNFFSHITDENKITVDNKKINAKGFDLF